MSHIDTLIANLQPVKFDSNIEVVFRHINHSVVEWPQDFISGTKRELKEAITATRKLDSSVPISIQIIDEIANDLPQLVAHDIDKYGYFIYQLTDDLIRYAKVVRTKNE